MTKKAHHPLENHHTFVYRRAFYLFDRRHRADRQYSAYRGARAEKRLMNTARTVSEMTDVKRALEQKNKGKTCAMRSKK